MTTESDQKLFEAVKKFSVLYDKQDKYFKGTLMQIWKFHYMFWFI